MRQGSPALRITESTLQKLNAEASGRTWPKAGALGRPPLPSAFRPVGPRGSERSQRQQSMERGSHHSEPPADEDEGSDGNSLSYVRRPWAPAQASAALASSTGAGCVALLSLYPVHTDARPSLSAPVCTQSRSQSLATGSRSGQDKRPSLFAAFPDIKPTGRHDHIIDAMGAAHADTIRRRSGVSRCLHAGLGPAGAEGRQRQQAHRAADPVLMPGAQCVQTLCAAPHVWCLHPISCMTCYLGAAGNEAAGAICA